MLKRFHLSSSLEKVSCWLLQNIALASDKKEYFCNISKPDEFYKYTQFLKEFGKAKYQANQYYNQSDQGEQKTTNMYGGKQAQWM